MSKRIRSRKLALCGVFVVVGVALMLTHVLARSQPPPATGFAFSTASSTVTPLTNDSTEPPYVGGLFKVRLEMDQFRAVKWLGIKPVYASARWRASAVHETTDGGGTRSVDLSEAEVRALITKHAATLDSLHVRVKSRPNYELGGIDSETGFRHLIAHRITTFHNRAVLWPHVLESLVILFAKPWSLYAGLVVMSAGFVIAAMPHREFRWRCSACGYDLRGTPPGSPCPECGKVPEVVASPATSP